ncbi:hypothetical protein [Sorangium sp. So ce117]|uniref:hypothetical protein n=1 Tax=Sorangium sp. So ce117 TaxID=3133277 RepID=UPI003F63ADDB
MTGSSRKTIYNLEFPPWIYQLNIGPYHFKRAENYKEELSRLQHIVAGQAEFRISPNAGANAVTAYVEGPANEKSVIFSDSRNKTGLDDVLLLLSIFTRRDVFTLDPNADHPLIEDPRMYARGGILRCSIPYKRAGDGSHGDIGLEEELNRIVALTKDPAWQQRYENGHFLFLAREAFKRQSIESSFTQCWTIWEHLFGVLNKAWMSPETIRSLYAREKIAHILSVFAIRAEIDQKARARIEALAEVRNRLIHHGRLPAREGAHDEAELFCQITEFVVAKALGLYPSNLFNTVESFENFIQNERPPAKPQPGAKPQKSQQPQKKAQESQRPESQAGQKRGSKKPSGT